MISTRLDDDLWVVTLDDGGRNALGPDALDGLVAAFDDAPGEARAIVLLGRAGALTAGLDVKWIQQADADGVADLVTRLGRAALRIWTEPRPTVCGVEGHAVAAGTMLTMACDHTVAAEGDWRFGLTEVRIDFAVPDYGVALARANVRADRLDQLLLAGEFVDATGALEVGYVDRLVPADEVRAAAFSRARELAALPQGSYAAMKRRLRGATAAALQDDLERDVARMVAQSGVARG